jgi:hypothetical protein
VRINRLSRLCHRASFDVRVKSAGSIHIWHFFFGCLGNPHDQFRAGAWSGSWDLGGMQNRCMRKILGIRMFGPLCGHII